MTLWMKGRGVDEDSDLPMDKLFIGVFQIATVANANVLKTVRRAKGDTRWRERGSARVCDGYSPGRLSYRASRRTNMTEFRFILAPSLARQVG